MRVEGVDGFGSMVQITGRIVAQIVHRHPSTYDELRVNSAPQTARFLLASFYPHPQPNGWVPGRGACAANAASLLSISNDI